MGGEITAQHIGGNDYAVTLTVYRDTLGISMATTAFFDVKDVNGNSLFQFNCDYDTQISGILIPGYPYGVEIYVFHDTITLPGPGMYSISYTDCCRNAAILNMSMPDNESMILKTIVTDDTVPNSTPLFLAPPVFFVQVNTPWVYNPLPYDPDGDSLHWSLGVPLGGDTIPVAGYTLPQADSSGPFTIDPFTGAVLWTPSTLGNFATTVLVEEYRNGIKIGEIRRDMQMIVVADTSAIAKITNFNNIPINGQGYPYVEIYANQNYNLTLNAYDPNTAEIVHMYSYGEPYLLGQNSATFTTTYLKKKNDNTLTANFSWNPDETMARDKPYLVVFRVSDNYFTHDYTVAFKVKAPTAITENNIFSMGNIYPNPVNSMIFLPVSLDKETKISMRVLDILGNQVYSMPDGFYDTGKHLLSGVIDLPNGQYIAQIFKDGKVYKTQKIVVIR
jgi:hypothetical protein